MPLDSKADNSKTATESGANMSSASVKNKVAVSRAVASKAGDKIGSLRTKRATGGNSRRFAQSQGNATVCQQQDRNWNT